MVFIATLRERWEIMEYCPHCGAPYDEGSRFCFQCGAPRQSAAGAPGAPAIPTAPIPVSGYGNMAAQPPVPSPPRASETASDDGFAAFAANAGDAGTPPTVPAGNSATPPANPTGSAAAQPSAKRPRMKLIAAIIAVLVVLAGTGFGLAARKLEWIGPRTVPTVRYRTAAEVSRELETKGFLVKKKQTFNALGKGKCLGLVGVKAGDRLPKGTTVTVIESMGPGVPEGTVGSEPSKAETALLKMGVKVVEHEVVSEHPGKVAVTMPADGEPVRDTDDGIHIGVGITGDGIPVEIAGMDKDEAKTKLQQQGFDVTLKPRFSSRKNLGKIVRADPGIGVRTSETNVTLYYGVDASKRYDVVGTSIPDRGSDKIMTNTVALAGKYCTDGGNCLTLEPGQTDPNPSGLVLDGKGSSDFFDQLTLCTYSQDISGCNPSSGGYYNAMKDFMIQGDTGAMELYAGFGLPVCGTTSYVGDGPTYCDGTSEKQVEDGSDGTAEQAMSEKNLKYVARDFFVVMPVGADLDQLESNGYFDGSTTYKPYADRPYLIRRDNSAYPEIKATNDAFHRKPNPYAPGTNMQPFKKAPNAHNVYYLVEQPVDFSQFEEATVSGGRQGDGSDSSPDDGTSSDGNGDDTTESDDSSQSQSSQSGARTYTNARFSYRVDVPAGYKWQQESDNGDGRKFDATSGSTQISVWGSNNALSHSPQEELDWLKENLGGNANISLAQVAGQSVYLSYEQNGTITYIREVVTGGKIAAIEITYPTSERSSGDKLAETVPLTLKFVG